jgi:hypothetical protein
MMPPDQTRINRALRIIPEYRKVARPGSRPLALSLTFIVPLGLVFLACLAEPFVPLKPPELSSVNLGMFLLVVAGARVFGRTVTWITASFALLIIAWITPPYGSFAVDPSAWPWFGFVTVLIAVVAARTPRDPIRGPPLRRWLGKSAHSSRKMFEKTQRRLVIADLLTIPLPR